MTNELTPQNMRFPNDTTPPKGFCSEPRLLSHEVWQLNNQVGVLCDAVARLCELQKELAAKLDAALNNPITKEAL
jgi:hypothetical protein